MDDHVTLAQTAADPQQTPAARSRAFSRLARQYQNMAYGCAVAILGNPAQAEDAVQETLLTAWNHIDQLRQPQAFPAWLRRIALWQCYYYRRRTPKGKISIENLYEQLPDDLDLASTLERHDLLDRVWEIMADLPRPQREILVLYYLDEYTTAEIARFLDISPGAVRKRLHDARGKTRINFDRLFGQAIRLQAPAVHKPKRKQAMPQQQRPSPTTIINRMIKPAWCHSTEEGRQYWELLTAAIGDDTQTIRRHLEADPDRAKLEFWYTPPIHFAVREGRLEATRLLWQAYPFEDVTQLIQLADDRGHGEVADFLRQQVGVRAAASDLRLHQAIEDGDEVTIDQLLTAHPDLVQQTDPTGLTPLHLAIKLGQGETVDRLLAAGAPVDAPDHKGFRPVHYCYWKNTYWDRTDTDLAPRLYEAGAADSITLAAARGDQPSVETFLDGDPALIEDGDTLEKRPLSAAVEGGHHQLVRLLLDKGADPNQRETRTCPHGSALMSATVADDLEMAEWLLEAGADPNGYIDSSGWPATRATSDAMRGLLYGYGGKANPIWGQIQQGKLETVAAILRYCDDPFAQDQPVEYLCTPYTAIVSGCARNQGNGESTAAHEAMLRLFLQRKYPMPTALTECKSYLYNVPEMTRQLLENGLDPNLPDWLRRTPLHDFARGPLNDGSRALIDLFLASGATIDAVDEEDNTTPLGLAAQAGNTEMVELLLHKGADPNASGAPWSTPLAWAEKRGHTDLAALLRQGGAR
ncbi:MAG: sigma-70 family RNA polymerase sigma factor [Candidatus Latescibacteria bacterium]|nr:sigma-70 family RNA polymerase sigma factor [Candidatus Latescibacterota bacterium]